MTDGYGKSPMLDLFVFETNQLLEQLERLVLDSEKAGGLEAGINEVFRIMHTIKGSAAMMLFDDISNLAHSVEDVFFYLREAKPREVDYGALTDTVLNVVDFIKTENAKLEEGQRPDGDSTALTEGIRALLARLKAGSPKSGEECAAVSPAPVPPFYIGARREEGSAGDGYRVCVFFDEDCGMENIRAFTLVHELKDLAGDIAYEPSGVLDDDGAAELIRREGFTVSFTSVKPAEELRRFFEGTMFLRKLEFCELPAQTAGGRTGRTIDLDGPPPRAEERLPCCDGGAPPGGGKHQNYISVNVSKMDILMDLVGELVIAQAMVTQHPDLRGLELEGFSKAARQLRKITNELQDVVMSVRMVPLSGTFSKMSRIVRDMTKRLGKQAELEIAGGETEVDKNIIEHISDPLMHLIRNAMDHGLETAQERAAKGKSAGGSIRLEAKNAGGDVWISVQDDGRGLDREKIMAKAVERGLAAKDAALTDKEIFAFILHPGFSTKEAVTEYSGRGVGMDVVAQNIAKVGGTVAIDSVRDKGTTITLRLPLTLAIIDGMIVEVGEASYTIPIIAIKESFRVKDHRVITDTDGRELILVRGECYPVLRLHERYRAKTAVTDLSEGIMIMAEADEKTVCLFADLLLGQQQVVVKALPGYLKKAKGIAGCTLLSDGSVSLIVDVAGLISR